MCATKEGQNDYEPAFESWLCEQKVRYSRVDQTHRCVLNDNQTKTFDYLISLKRGGRVLVELKGRVFRGASLAGRAGLSAGCRRRMFRRWASGGNVLLKSTRRQRRCLCLRTDSRRWWLKRTVWRCMMSAGSGMYFWRFGMRTTDAV